MYHLEAIFESSYEHLFIRVKPLIVAALNLAKYFLKDSVFPKRTLNKLTVKYYSMFTRQEVMDQFPDKILVVGYRES